jgi:hypothetical protein
MKVTIVAFLAIASFLGVPSSAYSAEKNLIPNPGFEKVADDLPVDWKINLAKDNGDVSLDKKIVYLGKVSLRITSKDKTGYISVASQLAPVAPDTEYTLFGYIKTEAIEGDGRAFWMCQPFDKDKKFLKKNISIGDLKGTVDWQEKRRFLKTDSKTAYIRVVAIVRKAKGCAWFDDVELVKGKKKRSSSHPKKQNSAIHEQATKNLADVPEAGYLIYAMQSPFDEILPTTKPTKENLRKEIAILAAPGEYEPLSFAIYAKNTLKMVEIEIGDLVNKQGDIIPKDNLDLQVVECLPQMRKIPADTEAKRKDLVLVPELLEKDTVFHVRKNSSKQFWLTVKVPPSAKPGTYRTSLKVRPNNAPQQEIGIVVEVMPFALEKANREFGLYYHTVDWKEALFGRPAKTPENYEKDLVLMKEHGVDILVTSRLALVGIEKQADGFKIDYSRLVEFFELCDKVGMKTIILIPERLKLAKVKNCGRAANLDKESLHNLYAQVATEVHELHKKKGYSFGLLWAGIDEVHSRIHGNPELMAEDIELLGVLRKAVPSIRTYQTYTASRTVAGFEKSKELNDLVDVKCYGGNMERRMDTQKFYDHLKKVEKETSARGGQLWCYYNTHSHKRFHAEEEERLANGFWLWRTPFKVNIPCQSQIYFGNPYIDNDDNVFGESMTIFYPSVIDGSPISTVTLAAYREGIDDLRYINTLETAIAKCKKENIKPAEVAAAEDLLKQLGEKLDSLRTLPKMAQAFEPKDYDEMRYKIAKAISNLQVR